MLYGRNRERLCEIYVCMFIYMYIYVRIYRYMYEENKRVRPTIVVVLQMKKRIENIYRMATALHERNTLFISTLACSFTHKLG